MEVCIIHKEFFGVLSDSAKGKVVLFRVSKSSLFFFFFLLLSLQRSLRGWVDNCDIVVSKFELQSRNNSHFLIDNFKKYLKPLLPPARS